MNSSKAFCILIAAIIYEVKLLHAVPIVEGFLGGFINDRPGYDNECGCKDGNIYTINDGYYTGFEEGIIRHGYIPGNDCGCKDGNLHAINDGVYRGGYDVGYGHIPGNDCGGCREGNVYGVNDCYRSGYEGGYGHIPGNEYIYGEGSIYEVTGGCHPGCEDNFVRYGRVSDETGSGSETAYDYLSEHELLHDACHGNELEGSASCYKSESGYESGSGCCESSTDIQLVHEASTDLDVYDSEGHFIKADEGYSYLSKDCTEIVEIYRTTVTTCTEIIRMLKNYGEEREHSALDFTSAAYDVGCLKCGSNVYGSGCYDIRDSQSQEHCSECHAQDFSDEAQRVIESDNLYHEERDCLAENVHSQCTDFKDYQGTSLIEGDSI